MAEQNIAPVKLFDFESPAPPLPCISSTNLGTVLVLVFNEALVEIYFEVPKMVS